MEKICKLSSRALSLVVVCLLCIGATAQDVIKTVADKGTSGKYFAILCPKTDVAIDKDAADVFSVYTDGATARFAQLRVRRSRYVVKAGECAIIKTQEEKEITLEPTTSVSSIVWTDLISPSTDQSLDEFKTENSVTDGQCIYMLTNLERNGGFGFTRFTGDVMRKDNLFIVTTVGSEPSGIRAAARERGHENIRRHKTRAANDFEDGDIVPFLSGEAGNDDGFMTEITPAGPSFVRGDANGDGEVDTKDVEAISDYIVGKPVASFVMEAADVNEDGVINVLDIVGVVNIITK
jgi:hypothetical protein